MVNTGLPRVLFLHGEPGSLEPIVRTLEHGGYDVTTVSDSAKACGQLRTSSFGLVLAEADLRDDSGRALLAELRTQWPDTVGVILTDYASLEAAVDVMSESACDYVVKPCPPTVLKATVARAMERGALARALRQGLQELDEANARLESLSADLQRRVDEGTAALRAKVAELEDERRKREELIAMVAHDLGNPLTSVAGYAQLLGRPELGPEQRERARETLVAEVGQLTRLVGDLVDRSSLERGRFSTTMEECDVAAVVRQQVEMARVEAPGREVELDVSGGELRASCDRQRLGQVVSNLIRNALKYAPTGPIHVGVRPKGADVLISVVDEGPGVPPERAESIFEPHVRLGGAGRADAPDGRGLGLHIAQEIVEAHGGRIWVEASPNGGATFRVRLPRRLGRPTSRRA